MGRRLVQGKKDNDGPDSNISELVVKGHRGSTVEPDDYKSAEVVRSHWLTVTSREIEEALSEFQYSNNQNDRKKAACYLIAFFDWCRWEGVEDVPNGALVDEYILRFSRIVFKKLAGRDGSVLRGYEDEYVLPHWISPDVVFGEKKPKHRPKKDTFSREIRIIALVELLKRSNMSIGDAKNLAGSRFGIEPATVEKIWGKRKEFINLVVSLSEHELKTLSETDEI
ncbi:MAG: hypothetical protein U5R46_17520 [Gammaproteobacteria bacterium]|nr:hypothetical protein [Gammaproteobacteria bacterium]